MTDDDFVFSHGAGEPLLGRHVTTREFQPLLRRAELPPIRFHDLRHTFATLQLAAGTNPKIVSEVLGHKDVAIALDDTATPCQPCRPRLWAASMGSSADRRLGAPKDVSEAAPETLNATSGVTCVRKVRRRT